MHKTRNLSALKDLQQSVSRSQSGDPWSVRRQKMILSTMVPFSDPKHTDNLYNNASYQVPGIYFKIISYFGSERSPYSVVFMYRSIERKQRSVMGRWIIGNGPEKRLFAVSGWRLFQDYLYTHAHQEMSQESWVLDAVCYLRPATKPAGALHSYGTAVATTAPTIDTY